MDLFLRLMFQWKTYLSTFKTNDTSDLNLCRHYGVGNVEFGEPVFN